MKRAIWVWLWGLGVAMSAPAQEEDATPKPVVEKIGEDRFRVGVIELDASKREIRFPAEVNMEEGALEYLVVHEQGKTHESLLRTAASPAHLQVALKLLRFRPGRGRLFDHFWPPGEAPVRESLGDALEVLVSWPGRDEFPLRLAVRDFKTGEAMDKSTWIYTGSVVEGGAFQAEVEGSIMAVYRDELAIINSPLSESLNDENWFPMPEVLPGEGTPVWITIRAGNPEE